MKEKKPNRDKSFLNTNAGTVLFVDERKKEMKESKYRRAFDELTREIDKNLVNTGVTYGGKRQEGNGFNTTLMVYNKMSNGAYDYNMYPTRSMDRSNSNSTVPQSQEPIAFSKIMIATSVLGAKIPDFTAFSDNKAYSKISYDLLKKTWTNRLSNGSNTLIATYQNLFTYGWAAWRVYPRKIETKRKGIEKIIFDDIYREPLDPKRTWLGVGYNNFDEFTKYEVYYEKDLRKTEFFKMLGKTEDEMKDYKLDYCSLSDEAKEENQEKVKTHVTIGYYEDPIMNRYVVKCGDYVLQDGEMPNDDGYGSIVTAHCFIRNATDPYGVGLYEMMRGNTALYTYLTNLNAQQVEAEIFPLIFGAQIQNGNTTFKRGSNVINPKHPGTQIDVVRTTGNVSQGIGFADKQKINIDENTGVNNVLAGNGGESTLGATVIQKEAALSRLMYPRNSVADALELDALIAHSWIHSTYSAERVYKFAKKDDVDIFIANNPDYFTEVEEVNGEPEEDNDGDELAEYLGYVVTASKNLRVNFDFVEKEGMVDGEEDRFDVIENGPTVKMPAKTLFDTMNENAVVSPYIEFKVDPNSMLLPSEEIQKQTYNALFPVIQNNITQIFSLRLQDPQAAMVQMKALEQLLIVNKMNIFDYIPKNLYDEVMLMQPSQAQVDMKQLNAQLPEGGSETMTQDGTDALQPQNPNEVPRPQSEMMSAVDASLGLAKNY